MNQTADPKNIRPIYCYGHQIIHMGAVEFADADVAGTFQHIERLEAALRLFIEAERDHDWRSCDPLSLERHAIDAAIAATAA